jgi:phosphatidylethanolamine-binding protein (PEBP) family uncharacterized protein
MGGASEDAGGPWLPLDPIDAGVAPLPDAQPNGPLALTSPDFDEGDRLPSQFTCGGSNQSPALAWSGVPPGTQSLALVLSTPTNVLGSVVPFTRWAMWSIPASLLALPATLSPGMAPGEAPGANQVSNESDSFGGLLSDNAGQRYRGPCSRGFPQTFEFTLYALGAAPTYPSSWSQDVTTDDIAAWLETQAHVLARASLSGVSP